MNAREKSEQFIAQQQSLHLYEATRLAFVDVLSRFSEEEFATLTDNLIIMAIHEGAVAQVMHFEPKNTRFAVLQLTIPQGIPPETLRWVIAHEMGHVAQGRNWVPDDEERLETDASERAHLWGFVKTDEIEQWLLDYRNRFGIE